MPELLEQLKKLEKSDEYPFHMPGHKRNIDFIGNPYGIDITEIEGYDNLYEAEGLLQEAMKRAAKVCGARETFFLVNGSTVGLLSAITGVTKRGDRILVARNCHSAVFHAMELRELKGVYLHPQYLEDWDMPGCIDTEEVSRKLEEFPDIKAIVITSPTYEGIVSPIKEIAELAHKAGIPLIVDEAHGAHFPYDDRFPHSAIQAGADVVIQSMHKTLPSFTQTALIHMKKGYADIDNIRKYIGYYQTSSPSYLFMAGMDQCISLMEEKGPHLWDTFFQLKDEFIKKVENLAHIRIYTENDPCKIVISVKGSNISGRELQQRLLYQYHLQMEMAAGSYVLGIVTLCDTKEGFERLGHALLEIDKELQSLELVKKPFLVQLDQEDVVYSLSEICQMEKEEIAFANAEGRVSMDYVNLYPPGTPLILPGERITREHIFLIERYREENLHVQGIINGMIHVCRERRAYSIR